MVAFAATLNGRELRRPSQPVCCRQFGLEGGLSDAGESLAVDMLNAVGHAHSDVRLFLLMLRMRALNSGIRPPPGLSAETTGSSFLGSRAWH